MIDPVLTDARWWRDVGNDALVIGIVGEVFFDLFWPESWRGRLRNTAVLALGILVIGGIWLERSSTNRVDDLTNDIQDAQQSKIITLEKQLRPRTLDDKSQDSIRDALKPYPGLSYDLTLPPSADREFIPQYLEAGSYLVNHLLATLASCGWHVESIEGSMPSVALASVYAEQVARLQVPRNPLSKLLIGQFSGVSGVKIIFDAKKHPKWIAPVYALAKSLNKAFVWTDVVFAPAEIGIPDMAMTADRIHIVIGTKP